MDYYGYYEYSFPDYSSYSSSVDSSAFAALGAVFGAFLGMFLLIVLFLLILQIIGYWKVFTKAGEKGWKSIIPIYNLVILFRISGLSPWMVCAYLLTFIPFIGWLIVLGINIYQSNKLAKSFGKDVGYTVGLVLLPAIFYMILGLGKSEYIGPGGKTDATSYESDGIVEIKEKNNDEENQP